MANRTSWLIAAMAAVILVLATSLAFVLGRNSADPAQPEAIAQPPRRQAIAQRPTASPKQQVEAPKSDADAELRRWIVGGWAEVATRYETDTGEHFNPDGRYANYGQQGYWSVEGGVLTTRITHDLRELEEPYEEWVARRSPSVTRSPIIRESADRMVAVTDGVRVRLMRCPLSNCTFTIPVSG